MMHFAKASEFDTESRSRSLRQAAITLIREAGGERNAVTKDSLMPVIEARLVNAAWTLRRLPDRERGFQRLRGALWPEMMADSATYAGESLTSFQARYRVRITAEEIDGMQPMLDLLLLLPDLDDRKLLFWAAWHQEGEVSVRIPWAKVRRSIQDSASRWTLKRRYDSALRWLGALVALQK